MTGTKPTKLRTLLREVYSDLKKSGAVSITIHDLTEAATKRDSKLVEQEKNRLFRDAIGSWARQILRSDSDNLRSSQLILPMDLGPLTLPVCIPVWPSGQPTGEAEWTEIPDLTFAQLDAEIARKREHIKANKELRSLMRMREYLAPHMAERPNAKIGPVLARLAIAAAKKA
jgi:hypothetical protein